MTLEWKELLDGRGIVIDSRGDNPTRAWKVTGADGGGITVDPVRDTPHPTKPEYGQPHPDRPGLVVTGVAYTRMGRHVRCEARYQPQEFLIEPEENQDAEDFFGVVPSYEPRTKQLPIIEHVLGTFRDSGTPDQLIWRFVDSMAPFEYTSTIFEVEVNVPVQSTTIDARIAELRPLRDEIGKIHTIAGEEFMFSVLDGEAISASKLKITYRWESDPGIPNTLPVLAQPGPNWNLITSSDGGDFTNRAIVIFDEDTIVPPFKRIDTGAALDDNDLPDATVTPIVQFADVALRNPGGHLTLPGIL